ncbi:OmpH family outer membrane protein [Proteus terrae]|uniref:OmpH family outer membrane protein n=1 Tax=Proteus terrae TaxID=1574161 RepID=UPI00298BC9D4|nr:OmpH family outer membrane protein [Proteus terrae]WPC98435.1 OmpH family outer membrane protein [Proteus terrae]
MKKLLCAAALGMALTMSAGVQAADKVGVVNIGQVLQQIPNRDAVEKQLENEFKSRDTELQNLGKALQTAVEKYQKDAPTMNATQRANTEKDLVAKREAYAQKAQSFEQDFSRRQAEERNKIMKRVLDAVDAVAKKEGYDVILDANTVPYFADGKDITAQVQKQVK